MNDGARQRWLAIAIALFSVAAVMNVAIWAAGAAPLVVWRLVYEATLGSLYGIGQTLSKATPLILTGMSFAVALRAGLINVGVEGQLAAGILGAAFVGARIPSGLPWLAAVPIALAGAVLFGAALGGFAGWLRGRFGAHEVITTLMLNGLIAVLATWLYGGPLRVPGQVHTQPVVPHARLPMIDHWVSGFRGSSLSVAVIVAVIAALVCDVWIRRTSGGLRLRALGSSPEAARALGVDLAAARMRAMALSGAIAGLAGTHYVLGAKGYAEEGLGTGVGFVGIAVALLGGLRAWGIVLAAIVFGALGQGGLAVNAIVPADTLALAQAASILAVAAVTGYLRSVRARGGAT